MITTCSAQRSVTELSQHIVFFLGNISQFNNTTATTLISEAESIKGQVREFPVNIVKKQPILDELDLTISILQQALVSNPVANLFSALQLLDIVRSKIEDLSCC
ncbi:MAG TPA: hypothetical protein VHO90_19165 [Bacteroidales bacterium]|nr:hypothetical protein [Bacteroidales bacterium]